jgi:flagellar biogenesis protein FliO
MPAGASVEQFTSVQVDFLDYVKLIFILAGVLLLAYVALRFWLPKLSGLRNASAGPLHVVARLALQPGKTLFVVKAGADFFMIGTSESDIHYLTSVDGESFSRSMAEAPGASRFSAVLGQMSSKDKVGGAP